MTYFDDIDPERTTTSRVSPNFDVYAQDDGQHTARYAPYSPNTGFYYVRNNVRTRFMLSHLLRMGDEVMHTGSHQEVMTQVMAEHSSWRGLRVKVINRDEPDFPCGFHFHRRRSFMTEMLTGKVRPYIFHMSWTDNSDQKIKYLQQLGEWYWDHEAHPGCNDDSNGDMLLGVLPMPPSSSKSAAECCLSEPLFRCHFKGKPSKKPC